MSTGTFLIVPDRWYGWQMLPGYEGECCIPYCCPIRVAKVTALKTGCGLLRISFWNTGYAEGVQDFTLELKVLHRAANYLVARLHNPGNPAEDRCAVLSHIEFGWIARFCPDLWLRHPPHVYGPLQEGASRFIWTPFSKCRTGAERTRGGQQPKTRADGVTGSAQNH